MHGVVRWSGREERPQPARPPAPVAVSHKKCPPETYSSSCRRRGARSLRARRGERPGRCGRTPAAWGLLQPQRATAAARDAGEAALIARYKRALAFARAGSRTRSTNTSTSFCGMPSRVMNQPANPGRWRTAPAAIGSVYQARQLPSTTSLVARVNGCGALSARKRRTRSGWRRHSRKPVKPPQSCPIRSTRSIFMASSSATWSAAKVSASIVPSGASVQPKPRRSGQISRRSPGQERDHVAPLVVVLGPAVQHQDRVAVGRAGFGDVDTQAAGVDVAVADAVDSGGSVIRRRAYGPRTG